MQVACLTTCGIIKYLFLLHLLTLAHFKKPKQFCNVINSYEISNVTGLIRTVSGLPQRQLAKTYITTMTSVSTANQLECQCNSIKYI